MVASQSSTEEQPDPAHQEAARLAQMADQAPADVVPQLGTLRDRDRAAALATVAALGRQRTAGAARALAAVAESDLDKDLRKEARRGLHRLRAAGVEAPRVAPVPATPAPAAPSRARLYEAWVGAPDMVGSRNLWLVAERPLGGVIVFSLIINDVVGLKAAYVTESTRKRFQRRMEGMLREGAGFIKLPVDYARQLLAEALALNERSGFTIPHEFQLHRDQVEDMEQPFQGALIYQDVSAGAARLAPDWLQQGEALLDEPEVASWLLPFDAIEPLAEQMRETRGGVLLVNPMSSPDRQAQLIGQAITRVFDAEARRAMKRRLEEIAYVFQRTDRPQAARAAVATAVALEEAGASRLLIQQPGRQLDQVPFLRALATHSLDLAQHVLESGHVGEYPRRSPHDPTEG